MVSLACIEEPPHYAARRESDCVTRLFAGKSLPWSTFRRDATYLVVPALAARYAQAGAVSLQCAGEPGRYLRRNGMCVSLRLDGRVRPNPFSELFAGKR